MKIYIAGPAVFKPKLDNFQQRIKRNLNDSISPVFPTDGMTPEILNSAMEIQHHCLQLLRSCDGVLADVSPWYGEMADEGTAFEVGYAAALDKKIWLVNTNLQSLRTRLIETLRMSSLPQSKRDYEGNLVENFNLPNNAMFSLYPIFPSFSKALKYLNTHY